LFYPHTTKMWLLFVVVFYCLLCVVVVTEDGRLYHIYTQTFKKFDKRFFFENT